jgi:hypothetical protein
VNIVDQVGMVMLFDFGNFFYQARKNVMKLTKGDACVHEHPVEAPVGQIIGYIRQE